MSNFDLGYQTAMRDAALIADSHAGMNRAKADLLNKEGKVDEARDCQMAAVGASTVASFIEVKAKEREGAQ